MFNPYANNSVATPLRSNKNVQNRLKKRTKRRKKRTKKNVRLKMVFNLKNGILKIFGLKNAKRDSIFIILESLTMHKD